MDQKLTNQGSVLSRDSNFVPSVADCMITAIEFMEQKQQPSYLRDVTLRRCEELYAEVKTCREKMATLPRRSRRLRKELSLYSFQIDVLSRSNRQMKAEIRKLKDNNNRLRRTLQSKENYLMELKEDVSRYRRDVSELNELLDERDDQCDDYRAKVDDLEDKMDALSLQKDKFKKLWSDLQKQKGPLPNSYTLDSELTADYEGGLRSLNAVAEDLNSEIDREVDMKHHNLFLEKVKEILVCPLSGEQLKIPVLLPSGVTIDQSFYDKLVDGNCRDPFNPSLCISERRVNRLALNLIEVVEKLQNSTSNESLLAQL